MRAIDGEELHNELFRLGGNISLDAFTRFERLILDAPTIDPVKRADIRHIKYLWRSEAWYLVQDVHKCGNCGKDVDEWGQNFCSKCGAKLDGEHKYFRKKTIFVEGEDAIVPISHDEYKRAEEWEYDID